MSDASVHVVPVEILGQKFPIRSALDETYVTDLASYVDEKIRSAAEATPASDTVRVAVLAALNIADEYFRCRDMQQGWQRQVNERAARVEQLLDAALVGWP
jgi:cell division protein ZapA